MGHAKVPLVTNCHHPARYEVTAEVTANLESCTLLLIKGKGLTAFQPADRLISEYYGGLKMSKGISQQQQAIIGLIEKKGPMAPLKIWAELDVSSNGKYAPSFSNLCRCLRSLYRRGLLERQAVVYHNPSAKGVRYLTPNQLERYNQALREKYGF